MDENEARDQELRKLISEVQGKQLYLEQTIDLNPHREDKLRDNLQIIQMREIVEAAVQPAVDRTITLQSNLGDMAEMQMNME